MNAHDGSYDVVVIGGGAAGLAGAVALLRSRRSVLLVDAGDPRNAAAGHVHNFLAQDRATPEELYAAGRSEVQSYGGEITCARVDALERDGDLFRVRAGDRIVTARRVLVATGARDELPDIPGLAARWGTDVLHCPYCHGYEVRDRRIGVLATGPVAAHQALLFRQLSLRVTFLQHTAPAITPEEQEELTALGIRVVTGVVTEVTADADGLTGVRLADGGEVSLDALVVAPVCHARAELLAPLGVEPSEIRVDGYLLGTQVIANAVGATAAAGVWAAGNVASIPAQVVSSAAAGFAAAASINSDLVASDAYLALEAYRNHHVTTQA
jgi:thioredoxin reductase